MPPLISCRAAALIGALALLTALSTAWPAQRANAQDLYAALVKVNDQVISGYDLQQRMRLLKLAAPNASVEKLRAKALEELIADELKLQEAQRLGLNISEAQLNDAIQSVATRNKKSPDNFLEGLAGAGVERDSYERQLRADIAWNELLRKRYGRRVTPEEEEVDAAMSSAKSNSGSSRYDVHQIVVPLAGNAPQDRVRRAFEEAQRVRREMTKCEKIAEMAPRYSKLSGAVGKVTLNQMPPPVRKVVQPLKVGERTKPLRSKDGVHVIMLCGIESASAASRSQVYNRLLREKAGRFSDSYLEDLKRAAMIERRL
ncbi:MAG: SurA N-terminal domain-containing protein [Rhodobacteraceae bacterium]|nr:SurA N-terminal domain-containing protein [Paracoccaceae bacterium]